MTGRDLIIYILKNKLENEEMFQNGRFKFLMDEVEAAAKFEVGVETIRLWTMLGVINGIVLGDTLYFQRDLKNPRDVERKGILK